MLGGGGGVWRRGPGCGSREALARCPSLVLVRARPGRAPRPPGSDRCGSSRRSAPRSSPRARARRSSPPSRCAGSAADPRRSSPGRGGRSAPRRRLGAARTGSAPTPRRCGCAPAGRRSSSPSGAARHLVARLPVSSLHGRLSGPEAAGRTGGGVSGGGDRPAWTCSSGSGCGPLGELADLPAAAVADRFGEPGLRALRLARGATSRFAPGARTRRSSAGWSCPEAASGQQLERALGLLIERLLAHPRRRGTDDPPAAARGAARRRRRLALGGRPAQRRRRPRATAAGAGRRDWPSSRARRLARAARGRAWPRAPASSRRWRARPDPSAARRLAEAVRQARSAGGRDAVLRVVEVDPGSRVPERRAILTPFGELGDG